MTYPSFHYRNHQLYCEEIPLSVIAAEYGTPCYVYSLTTLLDNYHRLRRAFSKLNASLHYSLKANANLTLIRALVQAGAGLDAVSGGEVFRALRAGADPSQIVFAGVGKTAAELDYALEQRVGCFNVESVGELERLNDLAKKRGVRARVALRVNPDVQAQTHKNIATGHAAAKFGIAEVDARAALSHPERYPALELSGVHVHIGSQLGAVEETAEAARHALRLIDEYPAITHLNMGGGFPVAYIETDHYPEVEQFAAALESVLIGRKNLHLSFEPGRYIVANVGALLMNVQYIKQVGATRIIITDAGMTELIRPMLYDAVHPILPLQEPNAASNRFPAQVVGPICESTDVMAEHIDLPELRPGDTLAVTMAGAYGAVMGSTYNARPRPPEIVVEGERVTLARRRETWDDLIALET
jgi:diaminopimelate decarboxylase